MVPLVAYNWWWWWQYDGWDHLSQYRLKGELSPGMFPDEQLVTVRDHQGEYFTLIISSNNVLPDGAILVRLVDKEGDVALVRLPGELLDSGRLLSVRQSELEPA